jgi:hypothetical protein
MTTTHLMRTTSERLRQLVWREPRAVIGAAGLCTVVLAQAILTLILR